MFRFPLCSAVIRTQLQTDDLDFISRNHTDPSLLTAVYLLHKKPAIQTPDDGVMRVYIAMYNVYIEYALVNVAQTALYQRLLRYYQRNTTCFCSVKYTISIHCDICVDDRRFATPKDPPLLIADPTPYKPAHQNYVSTSGAGLRQPSPYFVTILSHFGGVRYMTEADRKLRRKAVFDRVVARVCMATPFVNWRKMSTKIIWYGYDAT